MAKKEFKLPSKKLNLSLDNEMPEVYKEALQLDIPDKKTKEVLEETLSKAEKDPQLKSKDRSNILSALIAHYDYLFSSDEISRDYFTLKEEVKFLAGLTAVSYVIMAKRLRKIRDHKLYLADGYSKFEQFVDEELSLARNTVYKYMDVVNIFEKDLLHNKITEPSKLIEALPLVKRYPEYKEEIVALAQKSTARAVKARVNEIRSQILQEEEDNRPITSAEYLKRMQESPFTGSNLKYQWDDLHRGEHLPQNDRLISFNEVIELMENFKREYPYWIDIADLLIKRLRLFSATKKEKMSLESACKKTPDISSKKPLKNETLLAEEELNDLLSPMAGMIERKEDKLSLNKDNSLFKNDLEDKKTEKEAIEAKNNRHDNLWQYLEQEGSLKDLFAHVKLSSCEAEPVKTLADDLKPRTQEAGSPSDEWSDDPFFATLEKTLDPNANSLASFEANKQENDFNSLDVERSTKELSEPLNESHSGLNWAGELRWHVLARKDLSRFKALLPEGFVMCDGESSLDNGAFHVSSTAVKGKLPKWLEEVDEKHVVVGILKVSAS
ncbi:UNVERIFIED_CONTAM: hypothetical protein PYX00_011915 [Menopon gallinae]|uniref:Plasmid partition protein putative N-terminal domain-containing protein n=1 Tax=Menopon gallinae TaxID=328185 RepID=A0AAW2H8S9_9NEOP